MPPSAGKKTNIATSSCAFDAPAISTCNCIYTQSPTPPTSTLFPYTTLFRSSICTGGTVTYSYVVHNSSATFTWTGAITDDNGTPLNTGDDITVATGEIGRAHV